MAVDPPVRVGLIGASTDIGWSSIAHLPALRALRSCDLVAVATRSDRSARAAADMYGARLAFGNPQDLLDCPEVELVSICVRAACQYDLVERAIAAGKHVYCEWPLGLGSDQSAALAAQAAERGVMAMVGLQGHASPVIARIRAMVASGAIGEILSTSFACSEPYGWGAEVPQAYAYGADSAQGATPFTVTAGHALDTIALCLGEFTSLSAQLVARRETARIVETGEIIPKTAPDQVVVSGRLTSGAVATLHLRAGSPTHEELRWEINGSGGYLLAVSDSGVQVGQPRLWIGRQQGEAPVEIDVTGDELELGVPLSGPPLNLAGQYAAFARAIRSGTMPAPDFAYAARRKLLLDAVKRSSDEGRTITLG